jgi:inner membrane transporter RhtA
VVVALGVVFAAMNVCFYNAIDRLPLGTVAAIEFVGPVALAVVGVRTGRNVAALVLAVAGVSLLADVHLDGGPAALAWAAANAGLFALYIVLAHRLARVDASTGPIDRLAAAMLVAAVVVTPIGLVEAVDHVGDPVALAAGGAVGITSSVVPYVFDQLAMSRLPRATYALFVALLPATAVVIGVVVLAQIPQPLEQLAVALVIAGVAVHRDAVLDEGQSPASPAGESAGD